MGSKKLISVYCDKIRSVYNVGSIIRTSEFCGSVDTIYFGGYTPTPMHPKMSKTSLGAENNIQWETIRQPLRLIKRLKSNGYCIISLETKLKGKSKGVIEINKKVKNIFSNNLNIQFPCLLIVGNEIDGIDKKILKQSDIILEIPMMGEIKESLNVSVAFGIGLYYLLSFIFKNE